MVQALYGLGLDVTIDTGIERAVRSKRAPVRQQLVPMHLMLLCIVIFLLIHAAPKGLGSLVIRVTFVCLLRCLQALAEAAQAAHIYSMNAVLLESW